MYVQIVKLKVKEGRVADFLNAFRINYEGTQKEPGNVRFELLQSRENERDFTVYEVFQSEQALHEHRQMPHFKECVDQFADILEGERTITPMHPAMTPYIDGVR